MRGWAFALAAGVLLAACGQSGEQEPPAPTIETTTADAPSTQASWPPVDAALVALPNSDFAPIEPSEVGIIAAPDIAQAIEPLTSAEFGEGAVQVSIKTEGENATADIVRADIPDDSISAAHVRIEFIQSPEGWFPANAFRRTQCRRGANAGAWSKDPCP